ncbi:MAG: MoxR family ATPase [Parachlamydiales bacterium]|jgi:MoxR-like ATPase
MDSVELTNKIKIENEKFQSLKDEIGRVIVGQKSLINRLFVALLANGHVLLEGFPGLAKTLTIVSLAKLLHCEFKRIQFTPDLLPADLIGTNIYNPKDGTFSVSKGPIFTQLLLADEINRAPAKVQSALLEVMQERQVTIAGQTFSVGKPFLVLATQNPLEQEGTYALPEAQTDRFLLKILVDYPSIEEEKEIVKRMATLGPLPELKPIMDAETILKTRETVNAIYIDEKIVDYILAIIFATRDPKRYNLDLEGKIATGASPRASIALQLASKAHAFLNGRAYVTPHDVKQMAYDVLRHRIRRTYEAEAEGITTDDIIKQILDKLIVP